MAKEQNDFIIKGGTEVEIASALHFRNLLFKESGIQGSIYIEEKDKIILDFYLQETKAERMKHFFAFDVDNKPVAVIGSLIKSDFPFFLFKPGFYGWIIDVFTMPEYRGRGLASKLLEKNIDWLKTKNIQEIKLVYFAQDARRIYEKRGFKDANFLSLNLSATPSVNDIIKEN